jgi:hypothetical protein
MRGAKRTGEFSKQIGVSGGKFVARAVDTASVQPHAFQHYRVDFAF